VSPFFCLLDTNYNMEIDKLQEYYANLSKEDRLMLHKLFDEGIPDDRLKKIKKIVYKDIPPTPEEFLDWKNGWISKGVADSLYDHVKEDFCDFLNSTDKVLQAVNYGATRTGKSFGIRLIIVYLMVYIHHLKEPQLFFGLSPVTALAIYLLAFKLDKTQQLLMSPIMKLIEASERFERVDRQLQVYETQDKVGLNKIIYSQAASVGTLTLASGLQILLGNDDPLSIIGADIIAMFVTEIAFFIEYAGATEEEIYRLYSDGLERIKATVGNAKMSFIYLDTSANLADSLIENYILTELKDREDVFFRQRSRWEARPQMFPEWQKTKQTFKVITGNGSVPPRIIRNKYELKDVPVDLVIDVPIDAKDDFERNLIKSIKDIAGKPTVSESKLIPDDRIIDDIFNNEYLKNLEGELICDSSIEPSRFVWNELELKLFHRYNGFDLQIRRAPKEPRWFGIDLAHATKGDLTGLVMLHKEWSRKFEEIMYVCDFAFVLVAGENGINLDAPREFIKDLITIGGIKIQMTAFDTFQSESMAQFLLRNKIEHKKQSVDKEIDPYQTLFTKLLSRVVKCGKNIYLKNNCRSLQKIRMKVKGAEKVDHTEGKKLHRYDGDWIKSKAGMHEKDLSDALCVAVYMAQQDSYIPTTIYEDENRKCKDLIFGGASTNVVGLDKKIIQLRTGFI